MHLALVDVDESALETSAQSLTDDGYDILSVPADIRTAAACKTAVQLVVEWRERVDVLVNAAGIYPRVPALEITEEQWRLDFDVNVLGTYFMMVAAISDMQNRDGGHIVNVSSVDALVAKPENAHYAATKAAVISLTRSIAAEVASDDILVNGVAPGPMATAQATATDWYHDMVDQLPTRRPIEPEEVARTVAYLCNKENVSITGETIIVSGGEVFA